MHSYPRHNKGFTLIELLIVVAILSILTAVAIPVFKGYRTNAYNATTAADLREVKLSLEAYYTDNDYYP